MLQRLFLMKINLCKQVKCHHHALNGNKGSGYPTNKLAQLFALAGWHILRLGMAEV